MPKGNPKKRLEDEGSETIVNLVFLLVGFSIFCLFAWFLSTLFTVSQKQNSQLRNMGAYAAAVPPIPRDKLDSTDTAPPDAAPPPSEPLSLEEKRRQKREKKLAEEKAAYEAMVARKPFTVEFTVAGLEAQPSGGKFTIQAYPEWSPRGADRFHHLVKLGYYDGNRFFRVLPGFMVQWGISSDPAMNKKWKNKKFIDDPVLRSNTRAMVTFATSGGDSRTTQLFVNYADNSRLDDQGFTPFGEVTSGMEIVDQIYSEYREQPNQGMIQKEGLPYLEKHYPKLSYIVSAKILEKERELM